MLAQAPITELKETSFGRMPSFLILLSKFFAIPTSRERAQAEITVLYVTTVFGIFSSSMKSSNWTARRHCNFLDSAEITSSEVYVLGCQQENQVGLRELLEKLQLSFSSSHRQQREPVLSLTPRSFIEYKTCTACLAWLVAPQHSRTAR